MKIRSVCITAGVAALALPALAKGPRLEVVENAIRVDPIAIGTVRVVNGEIVRTSPMYPYTPGGSSTRVDWTCVWDSFEPDTNDPNLGIPVGFNTCPNATPIGAGFRWYGGATYHNPFVSGDMSDLAASSAEGMFTSWFWHAGGAGTSEQCTIIIFPTDTYAACTEAVPDDGFLSGSLAGVILDFGVLGSGVGAGYYYTGVDFTVTPILTLDLTGANGNSIIYSLTPSADGPPFTLATLCQPMSWGTTEDDLNTANDGRCGTQNEIQYDDDLPTDGVHDLALECYDYTSPNCPSQLGMSLAWVGKGGVDPCACAGDLDGSGAVDISDLALFLSSFGSSPPAPSACADIDGSGAVDISDLALFLSAFGSTCP